MHIIKTSLPDVLRVVPKKHGDDRGWFAEAFSKQTFEDLKLPTDYAQENQSFSRYGVLRGLHYQLGKPQGKLVRVLTGHIWDVAVDIRPASPYFGRWVGVDLREESLEYLWIPEGFAHGFVVLSETANVLYKTTQPYYPDGERAIRWNDPQLAISWPLDHILPAVSHKDAHAPSLTEAELPQ
ncbi:MAG: dTDP-4-dehydrorhamnose 3,5-epimerase [Acidobacteriaceae bacterium]|nr:dTDP-4-dehydrorhamnose 3,5-epimerase [Acidobacteriaceae bacterium]